MLEVLRLHNNTNLECAETRKPGSRLDVSLMRQRPDVKNGFERSKFAFMQFHHDTGHTSLPRYERVAGLAVPITQGMNEGLVVIVDEPV